ncbi:acyl carrier protein [Streptomyces albidoflavus]
MEAIAPDADFFELGGQSFGAAKLVVRLREEVDVSVSLSHFFHEQTVSHLTYETRELPVATGVGHRGLTACRGTSGLLLASPRAVTLSPTDCRSHGKSGDREQDR